MRGRLSQTVWALGFVSLLTDLSSEMIYPLLPVFLISVLGVGPQILGIIEGVAESTAALVKTFSGVWSDRMRRRKPLVVCGYSLAGLMRPLIGLAASWPVVLGLRFADRVGKGLRTAPRDALIADSSSPELRGEAFGVQRAMDHAGAVIGPLVAWALLSFAGITLRHVFLLAAIPAVAVMVVLVLAVREPKQPWVPNLEKPSLLPLRSLGRDFKLLLIAIVVFTLGNSTDAFLLLRLVDCGIPPAKVAVLWSIFHVVKMLAAYGGGRLSDHFGRRRLVISGWVVYALVYLAFAVTSSVVGVIAIFLAYGLYFGLTEPVEKAWVASLVPAQLRGTAFGIYNGAIGLAALPASVMFGILWKFFGAPVAFVTGAALAFVASVLLTFVREGEAREQMAS